MRRSREAPQSPTGGPLREAGRHVTAMASFLVGAACQRRGSRIEGRASDDGCELAKHLRLRIILSKFNDPEPSQRSIIRLTYPARRGCGRAAPGVRCALASPVGQQALDLFGCPVEPISHVAQSGRRSFLLGGHASHDYGCDSVGYGVDVEVALAA